MNILYNVMSGVIIVLFFGVFNGIIVFGTVSSENRVKDLEEQLYNHMKEEYPDVFTSLGEYHPRQSYTLRTFKRRRNLNKELLKEINRINSKYLSNEERLDLKILKDYIKTFVRGHRWIMYGALTPYNNLEGIFSKDLEHLPVQIYEQISLMRKAIRLGRTNYISTMTGVLEKLQNDMDLQLSPFLSQNNNSYTSSSYQDTSILRQVQMAYEAFVELKSFLINEYIPATRKAPGLHSLRKGIGYYKACLRFHTTVDISPDEAHVRGLDEVERIAKQINKIKKKLNFNTDLTTFLKHVQYHTTITVSQQLRAIHELIIRINDTILETVFHKLQKPEVTLLPVLDEHDLSLGSYMRNTFFVNINPAINRSSVITIPLVLHEANPGHHYQTSYSFSYNQPHYRQNMFNTGYHTIPFSYPTYTAYVEGWALYAEYLGHEMGLYPSIYDKLGCYISEILRACRLVVDTGIHAFGWPREQGIEYIQNFTGSDIAQIENEVDMIITWPGRACSYKIGEMKILKLRRKAERKLGPSFRLKDFHDIILRKGPVSLWILEEMVDDWISSISNSNASNGIWTMASGYTTLCIDIFILVLLV